MRITFIDKETKKIRSVKAIDFGIEKILGDEYVVIKLPKTSDGKQGYYRSDSKYLMGNNKWADFNTFLLEMGYLNLHIYEAITFEWIELK